MSSTLSSNVNLDLSSKMTNAVTVSFSLKFFLKMHRKTVYSCSRFIQFSNTRRGMRLINIKLNSFLLLSPVTTSIFLLSWDRETLILLTARCLDFIENLIWTNFFPLSFKFLDVQDSYLYSPSKWVMRFYGGSGNFPGSLLQGFNSNSKLCLCFLKS